MIAIQVFIGNKSDGKGIANQRVKAYGNDIKKTDRNGLVTLLVKDFQSTEIYCEGTKIWSGAKSNMPRPITYLK